jgi:hypothetical protein
MKPSYDDKLDELEQLRYERELKSKPAKATKRSLVPPVATFKVEYVDPEGEEYEASLDVRIFTQDELMRVTQLSAMFAGVDFDYLPEYGKRICLARATVLVMWGKEVPEWLKTAFELDETISLQVYEAVTSHRAAWFRGDYRTGGEDKKPGGMVLTQIKPPPVTGQ